MLTYRDHLQARELQIMILLYSFNEVLHDGLGSLLSRPVAQNIQAVATRFSDDVFLPGVEVLELESHYFSTTKNSPADTSKQLRALSITGHGAVSALWYQGAIMQGSFCLNSMGQHPDR